MRRINPFVLLAGMLVLIFALPLLKLLSFTDSLFFSSSPLFQFIQDKQVMYATINSLMIAFATTLVAGGIGLTLALFVGLADNHRIRMWSFIIFLVFFLPPAFLAIAWIDVGILLNHLFNIPNPMYTQIATILLLSVHLFPICFFMILEKLNHIPPHLLEAGRSCGASSQTLLIKIILPLLRPTIVKSATLIWFSCLGHFTFFVLLGIPGQFTTLTTLIYAKLTGFGLTKINDIVLLCLFLLALGGLGIYLLRCLSGPMWAYRPSSKKLSYNVFHSKRVRLMVYTLLFVICLSILLPMIKLLMTSFTSKGMMHFSIHHASFENYAYILNNPNVHGALKNSVFLGAATAFILFFQSAFFEYGSLLSKGTFFSRARIFFQSLYLMPGSILAISLILLFLKPFPWLSFLQLNLLYDSLFMIFAAYIIRFFAFHLNIVHAGADKFSFRLIESAKSCGAAAGATLRRIFLPLVSPSLFSGSFLVFILILHEVTVSALLPSSDNQTIGVVLLSMMENGDTKATAALCILITLFLVFLRLIAHLLTKRSVHKIYISSRAPTAL